MQNLPRLRLHPKFQQVQLQLERLHRQQLDQRPQLKRGLLPLIANQPQISENGFDFNHIV